MRGWGVSSRRGRWRARHLTHEHVTLADVFAGYVTCSRIRAAPRSWVLTGVPPGWLVAGSPGPAMPSVREVVPGIPPSVRRFRGSQRRRRRTRREPPRPRGGSGDFQGPSPFRMLTAPRSVPTKCAAVRGAARRGEKGGSRVLLRPFAAVALDGIGVILPFCDPQLRGRGVKSTREPPFPGTRPKSLAATFC